jgi:O-antigen ligase
MISGRQMIDLNNVIAVGLIVIVVFTVLAHGVVEPWSILLFELMVAMLMLVWVFKAVADKRLTLVVPQPVLPLAALLVLGLAQSMAWVDGAGKRQSLSMDVEATRGTVMILLCLLASSLLAANFLSDRERLRRLAYFLIFFGGAVGIFGLVQHFVWNGSVYWLRPTRLSPFGPFFNRDHFAGYMELLVCLPVALVMTREARGEKSLLYGVAATMMGLAIVFTLSRAGMVSLLAQLVFLVALSYRHYRSTHVNQVESKRGLIVGSAAAAAVTAAIIAGVIWIGAKPVINRIATGDPGNSNVQKAQTFYSIRGEIWENAWRVIRHHPLMGVGLGAFETAYPIYARDNGMEGIVAEAHNDYLQILADAGIVGAALALWFIVAIFRAVARGVRSRDRLLAGIALGSGAGLFGLLVHSVFDFNLHLPSHALLFLVLSMVVSYIGATVDQRVKSSTIASGLNQNRQHWDTGRKSPFGAYVRFFFGLI